jgi:acetyl-CoA synthetase
MLRQDQDYETLCATFQWPQDQRYNIGFDICDRHCAEGRGDAPAIISETSDGSVETWTFAALKEKSDRLAAALAARGVERGDRVAILMPQAVETAIAHIATYKLGAIAVPLFTLFGADALTYRLSDCGARALVFGAADAARVQALRDDLPELKVLLCVTENAATPTVGESFWQAITDAPPTLPIVDTAADDPAVIIYTSGTTGKPKGALHGHRVLWGHLPGVELPQNLFPQAGDLFWTPADWAWIGGLLDVLLPALHHGVPVLAKRFSKFTPEDAFALMARHKVRNAFMPPTALKLMRAIKDPAQRWPFAMRSIGSGGETLGADLIAWGQETFGVTINEFYGQTECNLVIGNCADLFPVRPGAMGKAIPGHTVAVIDGLNGTRKGVDEEGSIAVLSPDPVMFLHYWNKPDSTAEKFVDGPEGRWLLTGDLGRQDADGYFWFIGRDDDVITSAGYRIGPAEVEEALMRHPAVSMAAAVGIPDPLRTESVKAFVVLHPDARPTTPEDQDALAKDIQTFVKQRMAAHAYPRQVAFVDSLPMTATGKIRRRDLRDAENSNT